MTTRKRVEPLPHAVPLGRVVATRRFELHAEVDRVVELRIGTPKAMAQDAYCPVQLLGIGDERIKPVFGVDTFQALQLAFRYARVLLEEHGDRIRWEQLPAHESVDP